MGVGTPGVESLGVDAPGVEYPGVLPGVKSSKLPLLAGETRGVNTPGVEIMDAFADGPCIRTCAK